MAAVPQQECEGRTRGGLVVHDQDSGHASGGFTFGASAEVRKSAAWEARAEGAVFQDGTPEFRFELLRRSDYRSIPYSFSLRQRVVRPIPRDSAVRE
jgi:hypothetical protein